MFLGGLPVCSGARGTRLQFLSQRHSIPAAGTVRPHFPLADGGVCSEKPRVRPAPTRGPWATAWFPHLQNGNQKKKRGVGISKTRALLRAAMRTDGVPGVSYPHVLRTSYVGTQRKPGLTSPLHPSWDTAGEKEPSKQHHHCCCVVVSGWLAAAASTQTGRAPCLGNWAARWGHRSLPGNGSPRGPRGRHRSPQAPKSPRDPTSPAGLPH